MELVQSDSGYRFSVDAFLLAAFAKRFQPEYFCDMGSGCGVVAWQLKQVLPQVGGVAVEIQEEFTPFALENLKGTGVDFLCCDIRKMPVPDRKFDLLLSNPPYFQVGHGKLSKNPVKAIARHTINGSLKDWVSHMQRHLTENGGVCVVFPSRYSKKLVEDMRSIHFNLMCLLEIFSFAGEEPKLNCLYFSRMQGPFSYENLTLYRSHRKRTRAAAQFLSGTLQDGIFL